MTRKEALEKVLAAYAGYYNIMAGAISVWLYMIFLRAKQPITAWALISGRP